MNTKVYLDETGDNGFNFNNESTSCWFVVVGVIVEGSEEEHLKDSLQDLAEFYCQGGHIKSSRWRDEKKRSAFVLDLTKLKWRGYALIVDKRLLVGDGFLYQRSEQTATPETGVSERSMFTGVF